MNRDVTTGYISQRTEAKKEDERMRDQLTPDADCITSEDLELIRSLTRQLTPASDAGERPGLLRDINKIILEYDERRLRFVYFFANGLK